MNIFDFPQNDYLYLLSMAGDDIYLNNDTMPKKALINNLPVNRQADIRTISTKEPIKRGDLVNWFNENWLIISEIGHKRYTYYKGMIQRCNYNIKFNFEGTIKQFPCIADSKVFDIETNQYLSIPAGKIVVTMPNNADTDNITLGQRFISMKNAWKVSGIDRTKNGLIILHCDLDAIDSSDDLVNEIANAGDYVYTIEITNGETSSIQEGSTLQLNAVVKLNGNPVDNKTVIYSTNNPSIATVDASGLITGISAGDCIITASLAENPNVYDTIYITVTALPQHNYAVTISGSTSIVKNYTATYTATFTDNGVPITQESFFYITADDSSTTTLATIQSQDPIANTCVVKAGSTLGYVKLWVKNTAGTIISEPFRIQIKNIF